MKIDKTGNPKIDKNGNRIPLNSDFEKFNIIYGENGNGKSTLVNIFKSISSNSEVHLPKNWDRELESRKIITVTDQGEIIFDENQKCLSNIFKSKIIVLDRDFVTNYVHSGQRTNQHDKNTGQLILFLGDFHSYKSQLDKLVVLNDDIKKKQDTLTSNCKIKKNELTENINNLENAFDFYKEISTSKPEELAQKKIELNNKKVETEKYITLLRNSEAIISFKNLFQKIENPLKVTPQQGRTSLNFSISKGTLEIIQKIKDKGSFVFEGFKIVKNDTLKICPFCEQSILSSDGGYLQIIKNYQSIFDEEFIKLQNTTKEKLSDYKSSLQSINSNVEPQNNTSLLAKYKSLFDSDTEFEQFTLSDLEKEFITKEIKIVEDKLSDPLKPLNSDFTHELEKIFTRYNDFIIAYNKIVDELKNIIDAKQKELKKIDVKIEIKNSENENSIIDIQLYAISNMDKFKKIVRYEDALKKNENLIKTMEIILRKFREKVNNEFEVFISDYLSLIKKHIQNLYPNLDIVELEKSRGTTYDFRSNDVNCGFVVKYKGQDRFKALSEGEKQVIALAYFFAMVEKYQSKEEKIVVFDDPITSFDAGKRRQTAEYIYNQTYNFKQTFILTCDPLFRQYCQKFIPNQKSYYILKSSTSSILYTPKDIETIFNSFKKDLNEIDSIQGTDENIVEYGQKLRFCIEEIREKYLGHNTDSLSDVLNRVKGINFNDFQNKIDEILSIYNYCNVGGLAHYPKDGSTSWNELKNIVKKYQQLSL